MILHIYNKLKSLASIFSSALRLAFLEKTLVLVTKNKIRTVKVTTKAQVSLLCAATLIMCYVAYTSQYSSIIAGKSEEIERVKASNEYFKSELIRINSKLEAFNEYMSVSNSPLKKVAYEEMDKTSIRNRIKKFLNFIKSDTASKEELVSLNQIEIFDHLSHNIESSISQKVDSLENLIAKTGLYIKDDLHRKVIFSEVKKITGINLDNKDSKTSYFQNNIGGPYIKIPNLDQLPFVRNTQNSEDSAFMKKLNRLIVLEGLTNILPFNSPMKNYYISSKFGPRVDPFRNSLSEHHGLDFVGGRGARIISPSVGKIIIAESSKDYGNTVVIDHGFGITTRYGHMSKILAKRGDIVSAGQLLGIQGSTGRSTGEHLHYEIRYKNMPLNPEKFLRVGKDLPTDITKYSHVDS